MFAGANSLWVTDGVKAVAPSWRAIKAPSLGIYAGKSNKNYVSAIAVARRNPDIVWAGHNNGEIYISSNATSTLPVWSPASGPLPQRFVTGILIDPVNPRNVYITYGGYSSGNLYRTTDSGFSWTDLSAGLPQAPFHSIVRHPTDASRLYLGTEVGIFAS